MPNCKRCEHLYTPPLGECMCSTMGEILTVLSGIGQKGVNTATAEKGGMSFMQLFVNEKEVPTLIRAIEMLIDREPQCSDAEKLLSRIEICIEKQCHSNTKR